jgi:hypothetical protein
VRSRYLPVVRSALVLTLSFSGCYTSHEPDTDADAGAGAGADAAVSPPPPGSCFGDAVTITLEDGMDCSAGTFRGRGEVTDPGLEPEGTPLRLVRDGLGADEVSVEFRAIDCPVGQRFRIWQLTSRFSDCENAMSWSSSCGEESERVFSWIWLADERTTAELYIAGQRVGWEVRLCPVAK